MAAKSVTPTTRNAVLREIVRRLVDTYQPEKIYLFGAAARVEAKPDSDYDVLVWRRKYFEDRLCLDTSLSSTGNGRAGCSMRGELRVHAPKSAPTANASTRAEKALATEWHGRTRKHVHWVFRSLCPLCLCGEKVS